MEWRDSEGCKRGGIRDDDLNTVYHCQTQNTPKNEQIKHAVKREFNKGPQEVSQPLQGHWVL